MNGHLVNQILHPQLRSDNTLHVIGVIQNAVRYHSRYRLFRAWLKDMLHTPNVKVHVVEAIYGDRRPECAPSDGLHYSYHCVHTTSEIWLKENLINLGVRMLLPNDWKYMAWVDCDVHFRDPDWALGTIHQLQHYNIIQPWQSGCDLDHHGNVMNTWTSFGSLCAKGLPMWHGKGKDGYTYGHTGYSVACTRYFYENVQKLADFNIVGAGDHLMLWACLNRVDETMPRTITPGYKRMCDTWQLAANRACAGLVGFLPGRIEHSFHGNKVNRNYWGRWEILTKTHYDPYTDLSYDSQGVLQLCGRNKYPIEHAIMRYNRARCEDDIS